MKSILKSGLLVLTVVAVAFLSLGGAGRPTKPGQDKLMKLPDFKFLDINSLNITINSNGDFASSHLTAAAGAEWPKGTGKTCVYAGGLWIAGVHRPTHRIRGAFMDQSNEFQPGPLLETFNTTTNDGSAANGRSQDSKWRLYKIDKRDLKADPKPADLAQWPGDAGAPNLGQNPDGSWIPKFYGDQQVWTVVNDANTALHQAVSTTAPMGVEVQCLYFGFNLPGALGNMVFLKWTVINKSDADYDSTFVSMWSDIDLGNGNDDMPGCDTNLSLGYCYNGTNTDLPAAFSYGVDPPADGYDFFEGPKVPGLPTDSALVDGQWRKGFKNLPMTACVNYFNGTFTQCVDPPLGDPRYPSIAYDYMKGLAGTVHQPVLSNVTGQQITRWFSGDPVLGTGDLPKNFYFGTVDQQDIRVMLSSGPFTLAKGDTQEVVGAFLIGRGSNNLTSITTLKTYDALAQDAFNNNFVLPSAPPLPDVQVSYLPNQIVFDWTHQPDSTEFYDFKNYKFQGYTLYQGETPTVDGPWHEVGSWSLKNGITVVKDYVINPIDQQPYLIPVVSFPNKGIQRYFIADKDYINSGPLVNGKQYYFALTTWAYNVDPNALANGVTLTLQHSIEPITVVPRMPEVGTSIPTSTRQILPTNRPGDDALQPEVIRPDKLTGATYTATVAGSGSNATSWMVTRQLPGLGAIDTVVSNSTYFTIDDRAPYADGILFGLKKPTPGVRPDTLDPSKPGTGWAFYSGPGPAVTRWFKGQSVLPLPALDAGATAGGLAWPQNAQDLGPAGKKASAVTPDQLVRVELRFGAGNSQQAYRYAGNFKKGLGNNPIADSAFLPWVKVRAAGTSYQGDYATVTVPFTAWSVDSITGEASSPRQLNVGFTEWNDTLWSQPDTAGKRTYLGRGNINGQWDPTTASTGGNEVVVIFKSTYSPTENTRYTVNPKNPTLPLDLAGNMDSLDVMYALYLKRADSAATWHNGDKITIIPDYVLMPGRQFAFTAPAPTFNSPVLMAKNLDQINVFPNPYFGGNQAEVGFTNRFVTFSHLPASAKIRIFTITGELVRTIIHSNSNPASFDNTYERWDLRNSNSLPVASGVYLAYIETPGGVKILKVAVIQPEERPSRI